MNSVPQRGLRKAAPGAWAAFEKFTVPEATPG